jgi:hypothetical protein
MRKRTAKDAKSAKEERRNEEKLKDLLTPQKLTEY